MGLPVPGGQQDERCPAGAVRAALPTGAGDATAGQLHPEEWTAYEREKIAEQDFWSGLAYARRQGWQEGEAKGFKDRAARGLQQAILDLCEVLGLAVDAAWRGRLEAISAEELDALREHLKRHRALPPLG